MKLRPALLQQLLSYVHHRDEGQDSGWYFGNKEQFEYRHREILDILERELRQHAASSPITKEKS